MLPDIARIKTHTSHSHRLSSPAPNCPYLKGNNFWGKYRDIRINSHSKPSHYALKLSFKCSEGIPNNEYSKLTNIVKHYQQPVKMQVLEKAVKDFSLNCIKMQEYQSNKEEADRQPFGQKSGELLEEKLQNSKSIIEDCSLIATGNKEQPLLIKPTEICSLKGRIRQITSTHTTESQHSISFYENPSHILPTLHPKIEKALQGNEKDIESILFSNQKESEQTSEDESEGKREEKSIFHFKLDVFNDSFRFKREKSLPSDTNRRRSTRKTKDNGNHISPLLQRKKFYPNTDLNASTHAFYYFSAEDQQNAGTESDQLAKALRNEVYADYKSGIKYEKIRKLDYITKCIKQKKIMMEYDINSIMFDKLDPANFIVLYKCLKNALNPHFNSFESDEINILDNEIVESMITSQKDRINELFSESDAKQIMLYDDILSKAVQGKIFLGFWTSKHNITYPTSRLSSILLQDDSQIYIFGGVSTSRCNDIWQLSLQPNESYEWKCLSTGDPELEARYAVSGCLFKNKIYIFGGFGDYFKSVKTRKGFGDFWEFDINNKKWTQNNCDSAHRISQRAYASSCLMDGCLFIHGGTNGITKGVYADMGLYDICIFIIKHDRHGLR